MAELQHDRRLVERLAVVYEGSAALHADRAQSEKERRHVAFNQWSQHEMLAASDMAVAASYWSLIDPRRAVRLYRVAAELYRSLGHSYSIVLALASGARREVQVTNETFDEAARSNVDAVAFAMVANELGEDDRTNARAERLAGDWRHAGNIPVGRMGIPLDLYGRCAQAMHQAKTQMNRERFSDDAARYVHRAAEVLRTASHDRYHWQRLHSAILPAEPEAVAMATAMSMMSHDAFGMPISEMLDLDEYGRQLVTLGDQMRGAALRGTEGL